MDDEFPDDVVNAHTDSDPDRTRWFVQRFAGAIASCYRTMDPVVAQVVAAPGVAPVVRTED